MKLLKNTKILLIYLGIIQIHKVYCNKVACNCKTQIPENVKNGRRQEIEKILLIYLGMIV